MSERIPRTRGARWADAFGHMSAVPCRSSPVGARQERRPTDCVRAPAASGFRCAARSDPNPTKTRTVARISMRRWRFFVAWRRKHPWEPTRGIPRGSCFRLATRTSRPGTIGRTTWGVLVARTIRRAVASVGAGRTGCRRFGRRRPYGELSPRSGPAVRGAEPRSAGGVVITAPSRQRGETDGAQENATDTSVRAGALHARTAATPFACFKVMPCPCLQP